MVAGKSPGTLNRMIEALRKPFGAKAKARAVVVCPANQMPATVELGTNQRLSACSRLPEQEVCNVDCASQLQYAREDLESFLTRHEGNACTVCGASISADDWYKSRLTEHSPTEGTGKVVPIRGGDSAPVCHDCHRNQ